MSQQVYSNSIDKYSPQPVINKLTLSGNVICNATSFAGLPAVMPSTGMYFDVCNGVTATRAGDGTVNYPALVFPSTTADIIPVSKNAGADRPTFAAAGDTYFKVITSGTYTFEFVAAISGPGAANQMYQIGFVLSDNLQPTSTIEPEMYCPATFWSANNTAGEYGLTSVFSKFLKAGQLVKPVVITTNGCTVLKGPTTKAQTTYLTYYKQ